MDVSPEDVTKSIDQMLEATDHLKQRLVEAGYDTEMVSEWFPYLYEILYAWRDAQLWLADRICNASDLDEVPRLLHRYASSVLYVTKPLVEGNLFPLHFLLGNYLITEARKRHESE